MANLFVSLLLRRWRSNSSPVIRHINLHQLFYWIIVLYRGGLLKSTRAFWVDADRDIVECRGSVPLQILESILDYFPSPHGAESRHKSCRDAPRHLFLHFHAINVYSRQLRWAGSNALPVFGLYSFRFIVSIYHGGTFGET